MYTYEKYTNDNLLLSNSIVVKMLDVALAINDGLTIKYETLPSEDKREWKYFLNISGQRHFDNTDVYVTVIETNEERLLTLQLLEEYPYTKNELLKNGYYYNTLLEKYPDELLYIHGCMYPVDINKAIEAKDGTILAYNKTLVQHNEYTLIKQLQTHIKSFFNRWYITGYYIVEELYIASFLTTLYATLPNKIANIRLDNINTSEVHMFHLEHYFRSRLNLWDDIKKLKYETIFWLYVNLEHLIKNVGKQTTLDKIVHKIFEENGIGIGETIIRIESGKDLDIANPYKDTFTSGTIVLQNEALNSKYTLNEDSISTVEGLVLKEIDSIEEINVHNKIERDKSIVRDVENKLSYLTRDNIKTKTLDINNTKLFNANKVDIFKFIIDYWITAVKHNYYSTILEYDSNSVYDEDDILPIINFIEPNTNNLYLITPKEGLLILIKLLMVVTKQPLDTKLTKLTTDTVLHKNRNRMLEINNQLFQDGYTSKMVAELYDIYPTIEVFSKNPDEFNRYLTDIIEYYKYTWVLDANSENMIVSANLKELHRRLCVNEDYYLTDDSNGKTIDELLLEHEITYNVNNTYDVFKSLDSLVMSFTGISLDSYKSIKENIKSYVNILNKLTSYTLQTIPTGAAVDLPISLYYNNTNVLKSKKGVATVLDANLTPLEDGSKTRLFCLANNFTERYRIDIIENPNVSVATFNKIVEGAGYINTNVYRPNHEPVMIVDVMDEFIYDILNVNDPDIFILDVFGKFTPYELNNARLVSDGVENLDNLAISWVQHINPNVVSEQPRSGVGYVNDNLYTIENETSIIEVSDEFVCDYLDNNDIDKFILDVTGKFTPYESSNIRIEGSGNDPVDNLSKSWVEEQNPKGETLQDDIEGVGIDISSDTYNVENNNIVIDIEDE